MDTRSRSILAASLILASVIIVLDQSALILLGVRTLNLDAAIPRMQAVSSVVSRFTPVVLADAVLLLGLAMAPSRLALALAGAIHLLVGLAVGIVAPLYLLDAIEARQAIPPDAMRGFTLSAAREVLTLGAAAGFALIVGVALLVAAKRTESGTWDRSARPLVVRGQDRSAKSS